MDQSMVDLNQKIDALTTQVAYLTEQAELAERQRADRAELMRDLTPIANEAFRLSVEQLEEVQEYVELGDLLRLVKRVAEAKLPTKYGEFVAIGYKSDIDADEHLALVMGEVATEEPVLVRVHSECVTGDVFRSLRCDCGEQISMAMQARGFDGSFRTNSQMRITSRDYWFCAAACSFLVLIHCIIRPALI